MGNFGVLIAIQLLIDVFFAAWIFFSIVEKKADDSEMCKVWELLKELRSRVDDVEKELDENDEKKKTEFDISDGLEGILSYDPYASFQKGGDVNAE